MGFAAAPDLPQQLVARHNAAPFERELVEEPELGRGQLGAFPCHERLHFPWVDPQLLDLDRLSARRIIATPRPAGGRPHSRHELVHREGLDHVVVGPDLERVNAVVLGPARAHDDDRCGDPFGSGLLDHAPAVSFREHEIEYEDVTLTFTRSTHVAITGPEASGTSTLLRAIAGTERPQSGTVQIGARDVTKLSADRRPLLYAAPQLDVPERWSVEHALVNAVRSRTLDRVDRLHELRLAATKWQLDLTRLIGTLSDSERARVHLARIELRKPAIVVADKLLRDAPREWRPTPENGAFLGFYRLKEWSHE